MIPAAVEVNSTVTTVADADTTKMAIDQSSLLHLMTVLENLYSDPAGAVIREYSTNALDSHIEAGLSRPIEVTLPTHQAPNLVIRDFGVGLSVDDLKNVYSLYGASTKRESAEAVGMLGLGCKSAFTYTLGFTVTAVKDGRKVLASIAKDDDGVGAIRILDEFDTDEQNGVTVSIPVRSYDVWEFERKARSFFRFWKSGTVLVDGEEPEFVTDENTLWLDEDVAVVKGSQSYIVMGNVAYPFDSTATVPVVAWVPMGSVNFTPSRESLHLTSRTRETLSDVTAFVNERFAAALDERLAAAASPWDRVLIAHAWESAHGGRVELQTALVMPRQAYAYSPYRRGSQPIFQVTYRQLISSGEIITDFPLKNVGPTHRARLKAFVSNTCLVLPVGTDLSVLEGRPNVHTWQHVLDNTPEPVKAKRVKKVGDIYTFRYKGKTLCQQLDPKVKIVWTDGTKKTEEHFRRLGILFPEVQVVGLYENQVAKFLRLFPKVANADDYLRTEKEKAIKGITDDDKIVAAMAPYAISSLYSISDKIDDKRIAQVAAIVKKGFSASARRAASFGINIPQNGSVYNQILRDYPLLSLANGYNSTRNAAVLADIVTYINAKFSTLNNNQGASQ